MYHHFYIPSLSAPLQPSVLCWSEDLSRNVEHMWDSTRLQLWTWGQRRKEMSLEAEQLWYNWRKARNRKSNFLQAYLLHERFFFWTPYKPFHQLENPFSLKKPSGYVLERSATPPQNPCEAFKRVFQIFCLMSSPLFKFFLLFTPLLPAQGATHRM